MLCILANENVPGPVIVTLRDHGHDVAWIAEDQRGADDHTVLARAQKERRLVGDTDFGQLAFQSKLPAECGIILLRLSGRSPSVDNDRAVAALESREDWAGEFSIVEDDRIRARPLPERT